MPLQVVANDINENGGTAETAIVDALDEAAVNNYVDAIVKKEGCIYISCNAINVEDVQGVPLAKAKINEIENDTMLKRLPLMKEVASVAVFLVSGMASGMTGTTAKITCGTAMD